MVRTWRNHGRMVAVVWCAALIGVIAHWGYWAIRQTASKYELIGILLATTGQLVVRYFVPGAHLKKHYMTDSAVPGKRFREFLAQSVQVARTEYTPDQLQMLADMLIDPAPFRVRVVEDICLDRGTTKKIVTTAYAIPADRYASLRKVGGESYGLMLVPVLAPTKGRMYDREKIKDDNDTRLSPVHQNRAAALSGGLIIHEFRLTYPELPTNVLEWPPNVFHKLSDILSLIVSPAREQPNEKTVKDTLAPLEGMEVNPGWLSQLEMLTRFFVERYMVVAELPVRPSFTITHESEATTASLSTKTPEKSSIKLTKFVQKLLRIPSGFVELDLTQAKNCQSYHLYAQVPRGSYIGPSSVVCGDQSVRTRKLQYTFTTPYLRRPRPTGSTVHLYGRGLQDLPQGSQFQMRVYERPYGSELFGFISCAALFALAVVLQRSFVTGRTIDVGAAIVGLPAAIGTLGTLYASSVRRSLTASTIGVLGGIVGGLGSTALMATYMIDQAVPGSDEVGVYGKEFQFWTIAAAICLAVTSMAFGAFVIRLFRYLRPRA